MSITINNNSKSIFGIAVLAALYGCGGGDDATTDTSVVSTGGQSLSGQAADGYLYNATVCLDLNDNKVCDTSEPSVTTGENGEFTITGLNQDDIDNHGLIVEVIKDVTIDQDNPNT
ncbi:hypothetical protein P7F88_07080 [Vibrio hannami]|uniref:hypothetical protein n=1 Tax=Vibrio hannami TaxID=2717094 RepID=UPI00240F7902|nr:hypothetical protein [Vibrio hannami]MDG3085870.1 hypothetical protein [Vibrio hannami]